MAITYFATKTTLASGAHVATFERQIQTAAPGNSTDAPSVAAGSALAMCHTTVSGAPGQADWGSGTYRADFSVSAIGADVTFAVGTCGTANGHFARVDSGLTADIETAVQAEGVFSGTGLKSATASWDPAAGSTTDRFEVLVAARNVGAMSESVTFDTGAAGTTMGGPFDEGAAAAPVHRLGLLGVGT